MTYQELFDFESVTEETKFTFEVKEYIVFYARVETKAYIRADQEDDYFSGGFGTNVATHKTYSKNLGYLDKDTHVSHVNSIRNQLGKIYKNYFDLDKTFLYRIFQIPTEEEIESVRVESYCRENIQEIKIVGQ